MVLIGWPVGTGGAPLPALAQVRRSCEPFGARHRYHAGPGAGDPDAYLVVGRTESADEGRRAAVQEIVRHELVDAPVRVPMCAADLSLVEYADTALPPASTRRHPLVGG